MRHSKEKTTNYERVYSTLKEWIILGKLAPGEKIIETKLADALETSRTPVREALRKLEKEGMVVFYPSQGASVTHINTVSLSNLFECRAVLEGLAARGAATQISQNNLALLEESMILAEQFSAKGEHEKVVEKNTRFHDIIVEAGANPILTQMMEQIRTQILRYRSFVSSSGLRAEFSREHRQIYEAIKGRDAQAAEQFMRLHVHNDLNEMIERYGREQQFQPPAP